MTEERTTQVSRITRIALTLVAALASLSCSAPAEQAASSTTTVATASLTDTTPPAAGPRHKRSPAGRPVIRLASASGRGKLKLVYGKLTSEHRREIAKIFKEERLFEDVLDSLNEGLVLPRNVEVRLQECKEVNAFYDPEEKAILLCYEVFDHFLEIFANGQDPNSDEIAEKAVAALVFTFTTSSGMHSSTSTICPSPAVRKMRSTSSRR